MSEHPPACEHPLVVAGRCTVCETLVESAQSFPSPVSYPSPGPAVDGTSVSRDVDAR